MTNHSEEYQNKVFEFLKTLKPGSYKIDKFVKAANRDTFISLVKEWAQSWYLCDGIEFSEDYEYLVKQRIF